MPFDRENLLDFIKLVDEEINEPIRIIAIGGTAMTVLGLKTSTIDVDLDFPTRKDMQTFENARRIINPGFRIDVFLGSQIFSQNIPSDYETNALPIKTRKSFKEVKLFCLHPLDIVVTKLGRLNDRDVEDIQACIKKYKLTREQVKVRGQSVEEAGNERIYNENLEYVLNHFFAD